MIEAIAFVSIIIISKIKIIIILKYFIIIFNVPNFLIENQL